MNDDKPKQIEGDLLAECVPYLKAAKDSLGEWHKNTMSGDTDWFPDEAEIKKVDSLLARIAVAKEPCPDCQAKQEVIEKLRTALTKIINWKEGDDCSESIAQEALRETKP